MGVESKIFDSLTTYNSLTTIVYAKIYPALIPQAVALPAVCFRVVTEGRINSLEGYIGLENPRVQIDAISTSYEQALTISTAVIQAMETSTRFKATSGGGVDDYDDTVGAYRRIIEFSIWNVQA